jgi:hypothetical protein
MLTRLRTISCKFNFRMARRRIVIAIELSFLSGITLLLLWNGYNLVSLRREQGNLLYNCNSETVRSCGLKVFGYETPLNTWPNTQKYWQQFARIPNNIIDWRTEQQLELWSHLNKWKASYDLHTNFHSNPMIPIEDDYLLYAIIMHFEPHTVMEIGSGFSTTTAHAALNQLGGSRNHVCIEPYRSHVIDQSNQGKTPLVIKNKIVQEVPIEDFAQLQSGDILFIDSSHVIQAFGDTIFELVFILPQLRKGVIVHIHDICLPENYPDEWLSHFSRSQYTEQFMLAAFLYGNVHWEVLWSNWKMALDHSELYKEIGLPGEKHGSIWIRKTA